MSIYEELEVQHKCPTCGKFVSEDTGFYTREEPDSDSSYMIICCDELCADLHEKRQKGYISTFTTCPKCACQHNAANKCPVCNKKSVQVYPKPKKS